jgi:hypothetical protein
MVRSGCLPERYLAAANPQNISSIQQDSSIGQRFKVTPTAQPMDISPNELSAIAYLKAEFPGWPPDLVGKALNLLKTSYGTATEEKAELLFGLLESCSLEESEQIIAGMLCSARRTQSMQKKRRSLENDRGQLPLIHPEAYTD